MLLPALYLLMKERDILLKNANTPHPPPLIPPLSHTKFHLDINKRRIKREKKKKLFAQGIDLKLILHKFSYRKFIFLQNFFFLICQVDEILGSARLEQQPT